VIDAVNAVSVSFPILVSQGGTGANNAPAALVNLGALPIIVDLPSAAPAGGDFLAFQDIDDIDNNKRATIDDIVAAAAISQLVDSGGNIRVTAETLGIMQLRSVANTDAEARLLNLTHQDGTIRGQFGYNGAAEFLWKNSIQGGDIVGEVEKVGGGVVEWLRYDPTSGQLGFVAENVLRAGFEGGDTAWRAQLNSFMTLHFDNIVKLTTASTGANIENILSLGGITFGALFIEEGASAAAFIAGQGQLTAQNLTPNLLRYTDDVGDDFTLSFAGVAIRNADAGQSFNGGSIFAPISWGTTPVIETHDFYDSAVDDSRFTIPANMGGTYIIFGGVVANTAGAADGTYLGVGLSVNGGRVVESVDAVDMSTVAFPNTGYAFSISSGPILLSAGDFIELETQTDDTGSIGISTGGRTFFSLMKIA